MHLFSVFPNFYVEDVYSIDYPLLYRNGFRGLIFDIDNTLVPHGKDNEEKVIALFSRLHSMGFRTLLLSNNSEERIMRFNKDLNTAFVADAGKPSREAFEKALAGLNLPKEKTVMIGDTLFTDIIGANRAGILTIMVKYIGYYSKEKKGIKRTLEHCIMSLYPLLHSKSRLTN